MIDSLEVFIDKGGFMQPPTTQHDNVKKDVAGIIKKLHPSVIYSTAVFPQLQQ